VSPRIGLNLVTLRDGRSAAALPAHLDRLQRAGFRGVGLWVQTLQEWLDGGRTPADLKAALDAHGLVADEICAVVYPAPAGKEAALRRVFDWAAEIGCARVVSLYAAKDNPIEEARRDWASFVEGIEDTGVSPAFEFIGPWPRYCTPAEAWEVVRDGPELGKIVFDTFHFWRGGGDLAALAEIPGERIGLVHLNDVKDVPREQARDADRTYPGEGVIPLEAALRRLVERGFGGPVSVEIFGEVQQQDPEDVAARAYRSAAAVLDRLGLRSDG